jgi:hypothetical protein
LITVSRISVLGAPAPPKKPDFAEHVPHVRLLTSTSRSDGKGHTRSHHCIVTTDRALAPEFRWNEGEEASLDESDHRGGASDIIKI